MHLCLSNFVLDLKLLFHLPDVCVSRANVSTCFVKVYEDEVLSENITVLYLFIEIYIYFCVVDFQDVCLSSANVSACLMKVLHQLYEDEVLSEDVVVAWFHQKPSGENQEEQAALRKQVRHMTTMWLTFSLQYFPNTCLSKSKSNFLYLANDSGE